MKMSFFGLGLVAVAALGSVPADAAVLYNATTLPAAAQTGVVHYMQQVTLAQGAGTYNLSTFQLGVNFNTGATAQGVIVEFYTGVDTSATSTNALLNATYVGGVNGTLGAPGAAGNYTFTFTLNNPLALATPNGAFGAVFYLTNAGLTNYSTELNGRFSTTAPTVGGATPYVWNDANLDGTFSGAEQTRFGQTGAYVRFEMEGTAPTVTAVPEPATWAMMLCGFGLIGGAIRSPNRRRRTVVA